MVLFQSKRERRISSEESEDTPTLRELYAVVMEMTVKYNKLEQKLTNFMQTVGVKKQKINLIDWLTANQKDAMNYVDWLQIICLNRTHLELIFQHGYIEGMSAIFKQFLTKADETRPLYAFKGKDNVLYVRAPAQQASAQQASAQQASESAPAPQTATIQWLVLEKNDLNKLINTIDRQCMKEFSCWQNENKSNMYNDSFANTYAINLKKMMGDGLAIEQIQSRFKREIYNYLREDMPEDVAV
jgi:hypothetical protein